MPKVLWVALPLLLAAALLGVQSLRGRVPPRQSLNVWSSLLLLAYVMATAGLGIFWVANQQLPVFDWHYLFGYGTVLLVTLHLVFNLPVAWRYLARRRGIGATGETGAVPRRHALAALGGLLAFGAAFALGMRHGRTELRIDAAPPGTPPGAAEAPAAGLAWVERFHAFSSHSRAGVLLRAPSTDWGDAPPPFKHYAGVPRIALPPPAGARAGVLDAASLGSVLWHTAGLTDARTRLNLRASPSSGALFSTELYVVARRVPGLEAGLWHYDPQGHALERLPGAPPPDAALGDPDPQAAAIVVATAVFRRTGYKYRDRTLRYVLADLGHALENLRVAAGAVGAHAHLAPAFDEGHTAASLGLDPHQEGVLAVAIVGPPGLRSPASPAAGRPPWQAAPVAAAVSGPLGVTGAMHAATSLRRIGGAAAAPTAPASAPAPAARALPAGAPVHADALKLIATRRSVRRFAGTALPQEALGGVLAGLRLAEPPVLSPAVRVDVVVHAVAGLAPGAYRYDPGGHALLPRRVPMPLRDAARAAALDQDVIGEAACAFVLSIDRSAVAADPLGPARGYRHAFLEAGLVGERIYLGAGARGLGACAVGAFYDEEAAALVGIDRAREWVVHFAALGLAAG